MMKTIAAIMLIAVAFAQSAQALTVVEDNFNDNSLDGGLWNVVPATGGNVPAGSAVVEQNGRIEITNRGHLNTADQFDPAATGGVRITGEWTFGNTDFLQILTRSDGVSGNTFGETANGVEFRAFEINEQISIAGRGGAAVAGGGAVNLPSGISQGDVFDFEIIDAGRNLYIGITEKNDPSNTAFVTAVSTSSLGSNLVSFHNREGGRTSFLDNVKIETLADVALTDDFNDGVLDPTKWTTNLSIPQGGAAVNEVNGHIELVQRGHLVSFREFNPDAVNTSVEVSGQWTFENVNGQDFFQVITRSDGLPNAGNCCGETLNGIEFFLTTANGNLQIRSRNGATITVNQDSLDSLGSISNGDVFDFLITDDGTNVLFEITEVGNPSRSASVTGTVTMDIFDQNFVAFHNREGGGRVAFLDNVNIAQITVPEPATALLGMLGLAGLARRRRKA